MLFSFCVLAPVAMRESWENHRRTLEKQWRGIVYIGAFMALNIALNNLSLLDISLTLNQIIRCGGVPGQGVAAGRDTTGGSNSAAQRQRQPQHSMMHAHCAQLLSSKNSLQQLGLAATCVVPACCAPPSQPSPHSRLLTPPLLCRLPCVPQLRHPRGDLRAGHPGRVAVPQQPGACSADHPHPGCDAGGMAGHGDGQAVRHHVLRGRHGVQRSDDDVQRQSAEVRSGAPERGARRWAWLACAQAEWEAECLLRAASQRRQGEHDEWAPCGCRGEASWAQGSTPCALALHAQTHQRRCCLAPALPAVRSLMWCG